jgi:hypothetical protein
MSPVSKITYIYIYIYVYVYVFGSAPTISLRRMNNQSVITGRVK